MTQRLKDKNIIVTAAGQGIGKATAIAFSNEGANVFATDINENTLKSLKEEFPKIDVFKLDSSNKNEVENYCSHMNNIDVLFNAVGFVHHGTILDCEEKDWDFSLNINIKSMYLMCKAIIPGMLEQNRGNIINISSIASSIKGLPSRFVYGTTKAAIIGFTKSIASDFLKNNIRCNAIAPGTVHTPSWEERVQAADNPDQAKKDFIARQPMGRLGTPEEIATLAIYLASDESDFITGIIHSIDGGMSI
jgi:NAD(P)-dependent dehydrogenase (short-subunit alcohol dehydrogenase family)